LFQVLGKSKKNQGVTLLFYIYIIPQNGTKINSYNAGKNVVLSIGGDLIWKKKI